VTTLRTCVICHRQQTPRMSCVDCTERIEAMLADIPQFYALAAGEFWSAGAQGAPVTGNAERPIGLRVEALDARNPEAPLVALEAWEREWRLSLSTFAFTPRGDDQADEDALSLAQRKRKAERWAASESMDVKGVSLCGVIDFLRLHLEAAAKEHPAIDEFADEVAQIHAQAKSAARIPVDTATVVECPGDRPDGGEGLCGNRLKIVDDAATCPRCHTEWTFARLLMVARSTSAEIWQPAPVICEQLGISERTLRHWAQHGHVRRRGASYLWSSVIEHTQATA
jgi:hypothetical protein